MQSSAGTWTSWRADTPPKGKWPTPRTAPDLNAAECARPVNMQDDGDEGAAPSPVNVDLMATLSLADDFGVVNHHGQGKKKKTP